MPSYSGSRSRWRVDEVSAEESDDPGAGVASGRLIIPGCGKFRDQLVDVRQLIGVVVVEEPVAGVRIYFDVVVDGGRGQRGLKNTGHLAHPWPAILGAVAGDDWACAGQRALGIAGEPAIVDARDRKGMVGREHQREPAAHAEADDAGLASAVVSCG